MDCALHTVALSRAGVAEVAFQHGPQPAAAAVEQDSLVRFAQIERRAHIRRRPSMDVTQGDDHPLSSRQVLERASNDSHRLAIQRGAFGPHRPRLRRCCPVMWPLRMTRRQEPIGLDGGLITFIKIEGQNGIVRLSRSARVFAWFVRIVKSQVLTEERASKRPMPLTTASQVSWTTSSATAPSWTNVTASRRSGALYVSISQTNAASSPWRRRSIRSAAESRTSV